MTDDPVPPARTASHPRWWIRQSTLAHNPLPPGALAVVAGLLVSGLAAYGFLAVSARALGPSRYAPLATLYALVFLAAPGLFLPLEQETARSLSSRRTRGEGGRPVILRSSLAGGGLAALVVAASLVASPPIVSRLFDGQGALLACLDVAICAYAAFYLLRGALAGNARFGAYSALLVAEGALRVGICVALAVLGVTSAGWYGAVIGSACLIAVLVVRARVRGLGAPGPRAAWSELSNALGLLLVGSVLTQSLVNVGPLAVKVLAGPGEQALAGSFLVGLVMARIPLYLFQAVQASLLPKLAADAASGAMSAFRSDLLRVLRFTAALGVVAAAGSFLLGPAVVAVLFGSGFVLSHTDMGLLGTASAVYMLALGLAQALIALRGYGAAAAGWLAGVVAFGALVAITSGTLARVELGLVAASVTSTAWMSLAVRARLARAARSAAASGPLTATPADHASTS